jgi:hypothetical protein
MTSTYRAILVSCVALIVASAAAALEPPKQQGSGPAKLYFLREQGNYGFGASPRVKVDGDLIGTLASGSFVVVDRPAGKHTLRIEPPIALGYFETDVQVAAGQTYYFEVGPDTTVPITTIFAPAANNVGQPMAGRRFNSSWQLNRLDAKTGAAELAKLKGQ